MNNNYCSLLSFVIQDYLNHDLILPIEIWCDICMILPVQSCTFDIITKKAIFPEYIGVVGLHRRRDWMMLQELLETVQHVNVKRFQNTLCSSHFKVYLKYFRHWWMMSSVGNDKHIGDGAL